MRSHSYSLVSAFPPCTCYSTFRLTLGVNYTAVYSTVRVELYKIKI